LKTEFPKGKKEDPARKKRNRAGIAAILKGRQHFTLKKKQKASMLWGAKFLEGGKRKYRTEKRHPSTENAADLRNGYGKNGDGNQ